jgi:hypothetical protein
MRSFVVWVVKACQTSFFSIFEEKRVHMVYVSCYNILTIGIDMFQFHVKILKRFSFFWFIFCLLLFNDSSKSEN